MSTTKADLDALLARATALEETLEGKADPEYAGLLAEVLELKELAETLTEGLDDLESGLDDDEFGEDPPPAADADPADADPVPPVADADPVPPVADADPVPPAAPDADPAEEDAPKSWAPCIVCGPDAEVDEFKDGHADCASCGLTLEESAGVDFKDDDLDELEAKALVHEMELNDFLEEGGEVKAVQDFIRAPNGEFASSGHKDSAGPKNPHGVEPHKHDLPGDAAQYDVSSVDGVRAIMRNWTRVPLKARAALKAKLQSYLAEHVPAENRDRMRALVDGLGDGDGKAEAGEGAGRALASGNADQWLANHKKGDEEPLETKTGDDVELSEMELLLARRAAL